MAQGRPGERKLKLRSEQTIRHEGRWHTLRCQLETVGIPFLPTVSIVSARNDRTERVTGDEQTIRLLIYIHHSLHSLESHHAVVVSPGRCVDATCV